MLTRFIIALSICIFEYTSNFPLLSNPNCKIFLLILKIEGEGGITSVRGV